MERLQKPGPLAGIRMSDWRKAIVELCAHQPERTPELIGHYLARFCLCKNPKLLDKREITGLWRNRVHDLEDTAFVNELLTKRETILAEEEGFEPPDKFPRQRFSRPPP